MFKRKHSLALVLSLSSLVAAACHNLPAVAITIDGDTHACPIAEPTIADERSERTLALPGTLPADAPKREVSRGIYVEDPAATAKELEELIRKIQNEDLTFSAYSLFDKAHLAVYMGRLDLAEKLYGLMLVMLERTNYDPKLKELGVLELKKVIKSRKILYRDIIRPAEARTELSKHRAK